MKKNTSSKKSTFVIIFLVVCSVVFPSVCSISPANRHDKLEETQSMPSPITRYFIFYYGRISNLTIEENHWHFEAINLWVIHYHKFDIKNWDFRIGHHTSASFGIGGFTFHGVVKEDFICGIFN